MNSTGNNTLPLHAPSRLPRPGETLGRFRLDAELGSGAVGSVFKALNLDLQVPRALKVLKPGSSLEQRRRFVTEARVCARFDHPNLVRVFSIEEGNDALPTFMEMEYVDGKSLDKLIAEYPGIPVDVSLATIALVCAGLEHTQSTEFTVRGVTVQGLVHRDIKPGNILLGMSGEVKVADFGLAQLGPLGLQTNVEVNWGTAEYYCPEQHHSKRPDLRGDIYALGLVLYEMLCGARAFPETSLEEMAEAKDKERYISTRARGVEIPEFVEFIIARCLRANPDARYRTYASLRDAAETALSELTACSAGSIVEKWVKSPGRYVAPKAAKRRVRSVKPVVVGIAGALVVAGVGLAAYHLAPATRPVPGATRPATDPPVAASTEAPPPPSTQSARSDTGVAANVPPQTRHRSAVTSRTTAPAGTAAPREQAPGRPPRELKKSEVSLRQALLAFGADNYAGAIDALETIDNRELRGASADSAYLLLLGSYYMQSATNPAYLKKAIDLIGARVNVRDGYFLLCKALIAQALGKDNEARESFELAIVAPSIMGGKVRRESLYQRAVFYRKINEKTQSAENTARMIDAWRKFADDECSRTSPECEEARQVLRVHGG